MKIAPRQRPINLDRGKHYEQTDPDYVDKRLAQLRKDFRNCPKDWQGCFLAGLSAADRKALTE